MGCHLAVKDIAVNIACISDFVNKTCFTIWLLCGEGLYRHSYRLIKHSILCSVYTR